jgi:rubrerythrin
MCEEITIGASLPRRGMETKFNVFEVLEIAEQVDHKGAKFYLKTAERFADPQIRDLYYRLANWKAKHEKMWATMRQRFSERTGEFGTFDPDNYVLSNPQVMAGLAWSGAKQDAVAELSGKETKRQVILDAVRRSRQVVAFYQGLKDFARDPQSRGVIDRMLRQENRQIRLLDEELKTASTT